MNWYLIVLKKYAVFNGRARRKEYWYFILFYTLITIALNGLDYFIGTYNVEYNVGLFDSVYQLVVLCPSFAVWFRRLHDAGTTNNWIIKFMVVPLIVMATAGVVTFMAPHSSSYMPNTTSFLSIISLVVMIIAAVVFIYASLVSTFITIFRGSQEGSNEYGPNPIDEEAKLQQA